MKRNNHHFVMAGLAIGMLMTIAIASCSKKDNNGGTPTPPPVPKIQVQLRDDAKFGKIITDSTGRSLYFFSDDAGDTSTCYGGCATAWPPFNISSPTLADGLKSADFATTTRTDGKKQLTYKGWPLYYFSQDAAAGDVKGDPVGRTWYVAKTDYTVMISNAQLKGNDTFLYDSLMNQNATGLTRYLVDFSGHTLYGFKNDSFNVNKFTKADYSNNGSWPIDTLATVGSVPSTLNKADFAVTTNPIGGRTQLTFKGHPLYFFGLDAAKRGSTKGVSLGYSNVGGVKTITWPFCNEYVAPAPKP